MELYGLAVPLILAIFYVAYRYGHSVAKRDIAEIESAVKSEQLEAASKPRADKPTLVARMRAGKL